MFIDEYFLSLKFCIKKNDEKTLWSTDRWFEFELVDGWKHKDLYAYKDGNTQKKNGSINFLLYQEAFEYVKNKSLEDIGFMKKISDFRDQSKGQLNKILSDSSIQNHSTKDQTISRADFGKLLDKQKEFEDQNNQLLDELTQIKQMVLELPKIVKDQATNAQ